MQRARELLQEFWDVKDRPTRSRVFRTRQTSTRSRVFRTRQTWTPPSKGFYKINFDGAIFESSGRAGMGVVVRDVEGMAIAALSQNLPLPSSVDSVEVLAARRAIILAQEISLTQVVVERDSLKVIATINSPKQSRTEWGHIIEDIKNASLCLQACSFCHVSSTGNSLAHSLQEKQLVAVIV